MSRPLAALDLSLGSVIHRQPGLAAHLERGATTLCHCWKLLRRDGAAFGFTDHDRDLAFAGTTFAARTGLEAAEATAELGFAVGGGEVSGALVSAGITEDDLAAGLFDDASVETWLVELGRPCRAAAARRRVDRRDPPRRRRFRRRAARRHAPPRRGARPALPRDLRGRSRRRELRHRPRRRGVHRDRRGDPDRRCARPRDGGSFGLCRGLVHGRQARLAHRRQCRARGRDQGAPARRRRSRARPVAARRAPDRRRRHVPRHGRLRQALFHLRREIRQRREFPRLPAHAGQRFRPAPRRCKASRAWTAGACSDESGRHHRRGAAAGSARPIAIRPRSRASAATASGFCAVSGAT